MGAHISVVSILIYALEAQLTITRNNWRRAPTPMMSEGGLTSLSDIHGPLTFDTSWEIFSVVWSGVPARPSFLVDTRTLDD